ncbi:uncharacterized protein [Antedon mediterranea]|uniref:uncharacterized protein n=1 Tax=Antedon mediterranea TaxID=105859 RepID=UPI003AF4E482
MVSDKEKRRSRSSKSKSDVPPSEPRLCTIERGPAGYGFNLHGEKGQHGQYIRAVDQDSPAERAGLLAGDRVIEVNHVNIERETHSQVVARIKAKPGVTILLVVDKDLDAWFKKRGVTVKKEMITGYKEEEKEKPQQNGKAEEKPEVNGVSQSSEEIEVPVAAAAAIAITEDPVDNQEEKTEEYPAPVETQLESQVEEQPSDSGDDFPPPPPPEEPVPEPEPVHQEEEVPSPVVVVEEEHEEEEVPIPAQVVQAPVVPAPVEPAKPQKTSGLDLSDMSKARNLAMGQSKKKNAHASDWKSKNQAFNQL